MNSQMVTLCEYLKTSTFKVAAATLGVSQSAVHRMISDNREIYLELNGAGEVIDFFEIRRHLKPRLSAERKARQDKPTVPPASKIDAANLRKARRLARALLDLCPDET